MTKINIIVKSKSPYTEHRDESTISHNIATRLSLSSHLSRHFKSILKISRLKLITPTKMYYLRIKSISDVPCL